MNVLAKTESTALAAMQEGELMDVLRNSLYPGVADGSIKLVLGYCKAAGLDPMQKPVHLVPMSVKNAETGKYEWRDVIMPGIGLYRTQAARSGCYAGVSEPEFGDDETGKFGPDFTFPKWCKVTVRRQMGNGTVVEFSAKEFWLENYATASKDSITPNAMWRRRPYAQLAKCAEAQALRKAFPEIGAAPTADEMEGKAFDEGAPTIDHSTGEVVRESRNTGPAPLPEYPAEQFDKNLEGFKNAIAAGRNTAAQIIARISSKYRLTPEQADRICDLEQAQTTVPAGGPDDDFVAEMNAAEKEAAQ